MRGRHLTDEAGITLRRQIARRAVDAGVAIAEDDLCTTVGATAGGVMTAISGARHGLKTALLEPGRHVGGMVTGGLSGPALRPVAPPFPAASQPSNTTIAARPWTMCATWICASRFWSFKSRRLGVAVNEGLRDLSQRLFNLIDHVPARMTAFGFAVVGNFEDAVAGWRRDAALWKHANEGIILAAAAGAVGVQLGGAAAPGVTPDRSRSFNSGPDSTEATGSTPGLAPELGHLGSVVGLVWRSVVALLKLAKLLG